MSAPPPVEQPPCTTIGSQKQTVYSETSSHSNAVPRLALRPTAPVNQRATAQQPSKRKAAQPLQETLQIRNEEIRRTSNQSLIEGAYFVRGQNSLPQQATATNGRVTPQRSTPSLVESPIYLTHPLTALIAVLFVKPVSVQAGPSRRLDSTRTHLYAEHTIESEPTSPLRLLIQGMSCLNPCDSPN